MLEWLTPAERRGGTVVVALLLIGTAWDLWRPRPASRLAGHEDHRAASVKEISAVVDSGSPGTATVSSGGSIDLNHATAPELDALPGIGPVLAARIVEQRRRGGPYRRIEDLLAVRGVGPRLLERLRVRVHLSAPAAARGVQSAPRASAGLADSTSVAPRSAR